jgi:hypothetical protein
MNYFALGFGAAAVLAVGVADYANQAGAAGQAPGSYPASAYFASYGARFGVGGKARPDAADRQERLAENGAPQGAQPEPEPEPKPDRLEMSGGASCLEGSAGRLCRD